MHGALKSGMKGASVMALIGVLAACDRPMEEVVEAQPALATITRIEPVKEVRETPRQVCEDVSVTRREPIRDKHQIAGTTAGAAVGGVLGNQIGDGRGKTVATAAGAVAGGLIGNKMQEQHQSGKTTTTTERRCSTVVDRSESVTGYLVHFDLGGQPGSIRTDEAPRGSTIPVVNGQLVLKSVPLLPEG